MSDVAGLGQWMSGSGPLYSMYARICHAIVRGELGPGARLDPEDVSRFAFASQNDIAAALSALANARLLNWLRVSDGAKFVCEPRWNSV
jgi:DNA-binding GntR family transcriptional regulator